MCSVLVGGLDVHKESVVAFLFSPDTGEFFEDEVPNDQVHVLRAVKRWRRKGELRLCYEAGGCGFVLKRWLDAVGVSCEVIAPAFIPKGAGERIKTDRRDARRLAQLHHAGMLHIVRAPTAEEEAVRSLVRHRAGLTQDSTRCKNRILKHLRLLGIRYTLGKKTWTRMHRSWLESLTLEPIPAMVLRGHLRQLAVVEEVRAEVDRQLEVVAETAPYRDKVRWLRCLRGVGLYTAMVLITEIGDARRFGNAKELMSYLGLVPKEHNSAKARHSGGITKVGNTRGRYILTEAAWRQTTKPVESVALRNYRESQPAWVAEIGRKADKRLYHKYWGIASRKDSCTAAIATAREMTGFVWDILTREAA